MPDTCNNQGRAFEYAFITILETEIRPFHTVRIEQNSSLKAAKDAWNKISAEMRSLLENGAKAGILKLFDLEPLLSETAQDPIVLKIQTDTKGENGDVRDIVISRDGIKWEIGLSLKHNHFAVKHSRLSPKIDFGEKWYGVSCSADYWNAVNPVFDLLEKKQEEHTLWCDLPEKALTIYRPLLNAFLKEVETACQKSNKIPRRLVEYLLGKFDFYKIISLDRQKTTKIQPMNLRGTLNKAALNKKPVLLINKTDLPTRLVKAEFKPNSNNTVEIYLNNGWSFSFRLHNAEKEIKPTVKFDIELIGMPAGIITIDCDWR